MASPHDTFESRQGFTIRERSILALILVAAAGLRFIGVSHHLWRGTGAFDEGNNFVAAVLGMWTMHSADPHVYSGYAGFFNWMLFLPMGLGERLYGEPGAYLAGRLLVAAFSVVNVLLMALVLKRRGGAAAALFGAALLATSRGEVSSAHYITADILVVTAFLTLLLIRPHGAGSPSATRATGVVLGLAAAIKYTALILTPVAILETFREGRTRAVLRAAGFTLLAFALAAPFAVRGLLARDDQGAGLVHAIRSYYSSPASGRNSFAHFGEATATAHVNLGSLALLLALLSPVLARRRSDLLSPIVLIIASELAMAPADVVYPRHALPASAGFALLAALAFDGLWKRFAVSGTVRGTSAAFLIAQPLLAACAVTQGYASPPEIDRAADWIESNVPAGRRIVTSLERFQLRNGYEVRFGPQVRHFPETELGFFDLVVLVGPEATRLLTGCKEVARFTDAGNEDGALVIKAPCGEGSTPVTGPTDIFPKGTEAAWDLDPQTSARFGEGAIQFGATWQGPIDAAVIHLSVGDSPGDWPQRLQVSLLHKGGEWRLVDPRLLRPGQRRKQMPPFGQSYALPEQSGEVFGVRFERVRGGEFSVTDVAVHHPPAGLTTQLPKNLAEYRTWPRLLKEPKAVPIELWIRCMAPTEADWQRAAEAHGPHNRRLIQVYVNPVANSASRALSQTFPTGSILVKEKNTLEGERSTVGIAAMIKRDTPQFASSGGWEFVYVPNPAKTDVQEGCAGCHRAAPARRFVFGPYPTEGK